MEISLLQKIAHWFEAPIINGGYNPSPLVIMSDHGLTIALVIVAIKAFKNKNIDLSAFLGTGILALSYLFSSFNFYLFNLLVDGGYADYSLYLGYTLLDSLTVLCIIFAHAYYRLKFSFSANVSCYMMLTCTYLQFYTCFLLVMYKYDFLSYNEFLTLGAIYTILIQLVTWSSALILLTPIKSQVIINSALSKMRSLGIFKNTMQRVLRREQW